jgi:uncharacterized protein
MKDLMRYDKMVETALRGVVRQSMERAAEKGLPGNHHFYLTFRTSHPGVDIPAHLRERYPVEMTIVLQFQFYGLEVTEDQFAVTLSFNNIPERLTIPFAALTIFADPSVNFALQFQPSGEAESVPALPKPASVEAPGPVQAESEKTGEVVSLDKFRKK